MAAHDSDPAAAGAGIAGARLDVVALDCPDPAALAEFYGQILGWQVTDSDDDWVELRGTDGGPGLAFQLAPDYIAPTWPDNAVPQQLHLDISVPDLDTAEAAVLAAGARMTGQPPAGTSDTFRVYLDPVGHPFCLVLG